MRRDFFHPSEVSPRDRPSAVGAWLGVLIAVAALLLGGATALWAQTIIAFALGILLFCCPPRRAPGWLPMLIMLLLALLAAAAFLPDRWFPAPDWKTHLHRDLLIPPAFTRSPQPMVSVEAFGLFLLGLLWTFWTLSFDWGRRLRVRICSGLVVGVTVLTTIAVYCFYSGSIFPLWEQAENRGFFPNRNQMADVLALCGLLNYALLYDSLRQRVWWSVLWLISLLIIGAGLVVAYSRAGILLFFLGILLWHLAMFLQRRSVEKLAVSISALVVVGALFLIFGGSTLQRFGLGTGQPSAPGLLTDFRVVIQQDALHFTLGSPWLGVGLGNFAPLFAMAQVHSAMPNTTLHPESDWLWAASELGWPAVALLLLALGWWLWRSVRVPEEEEWHALRFAAALGVLIFTLHGVVDVAGHRLGSAMFALLLAGLAMPLHESPRPPDRPWLTWVFRFLAVGPLFFAFWWTNTLQGEDRWPTSATVAQHRIAIANALEARDFPGVFANADAALKVVPLDTQLYYQRGSANMALGGQVQRTADDFLTARLLVPLWPKICFDEGVAWLNAGYEDFTLDVWGQTLTRAGAEAPGFFRQMLEASRNAPGIRASLREAAAEDPTLLLLYLQDATPVEARSIIAAYLVERPELANLTPAQRGEFITLWWRKGNRDALQALLDWHPDWNTQLWPDRAEALAAARDFQGAMKIVRANAKPPPVPNFRPNQSLPILQRDFLLRPDDFTAGYSLFLVQMLGGQQEDALLTLRKLAEIQNRPAFIFWLQANLYAARNGWPEAWDAWQKYRANSP